MKRAYIARGCLAVVALILVSACSDNPSGNSGPAPGWLSVRLTTPNLNDGGIHFTIEGGRIDSVRSSYPTLVSRKISTSSQQVVVGGDLRNGDVAQILVPDIGQASKYTATLLEITLAGSYAQRPINGYALAVKAAN